VVVDNDDGVVAAVFGDGEAGLLVLRVGWEGLAVLLVLIPILVEALGLLRLLGLLVLLGLLGILVLLGLELKLLPAHVTEVGRVTASSQHWLCSWVIAVWASAASHDVTRQHCTVERNAEDAQMHPSSSGVSHPANVLSAHWFFVRHYYLHGVILRKKDEVLRRMLEGQ